LRVRGIMAISRGEEISKRLGTHGLQSLRLLVGDERGQRGFDLAKLARRETADRLAVLVEEEDTGKVPRDIARESRLRELPHRVGVRTVDGHLFHERAAAAVRRKVEAGDKVWNLLGGQLLAPKLVRRIEQKLDRAPV